MLGILTIVSSLGKIYLVDSDHGSRLIVSSCQRVSPCVTMRLPSGEQLKSRSGVRSLIEGRAHSGVKPIKSRHVYRQARLVF